MSVLEFLDSSIFSPVYKNDIPYINSPQIEAICGELAFAIKNKEPIFVYGDYDLDGYSCLLMWKEILNSLQATSIAFRYGKRMHTLDPDIVQQAGASGARVVIICDTGSGYSDKYVLNDLRVRGHTTIVIDHHVFYGSYGEEAKRHLFFNSYEERECLGSAEVSGCYASLLVAKVLCEKYMGTAVPYNAKVYALASMYGDCVDMSTPVGRAIYNVVALSNAAGPTFLTLVNKYSYRYSRRFFSFILAPKINGCFRMEKLDVLNAIVSAPNKFAMAAAVEDLIAAHTEASSLTSSFVHMFERERIGDLVLCVHEATEESRSLHIRNFTGVVAMRIAEEEKSAVVAVVHDRNMFSGSFRDFYNRGLLQTFKLFADCAGHPSSFKVEFSDKADFSRHISLLGGKLSIVAEKPYFVLNSGVLESSADIDALALYNEYMNRSPQVLVSHKCETTRLLRNTKFLNHYDVGLCGGKPLITKRRIQMGSTILIEPAICREVEMRERE